MFFHAEDGILRERLCPVCEEIVVVREKLRGEISLDPCPAAVRRIAVIDGRRDHPTVRARIDRRSRIVGAKRRSDVEMKTRKCLRDERAELFARERGTAEDVYLPQERDIRNAVRAGLKGAGARIRNSVGQNNREAAGATPKVHRARQNNRLEKGIRNRAGRNVRTVFRRNGCHVAGIVHDQPGIDRRVEVVSCRAAICRG